MVQLNRSAADALLRLPAGSVHACTDITGFGVVGHATEMARASGCVVALDVAAIPVLDGALGLVDRNTPGGGRTNLEHFGAGVTAVAGLDPRRVQLLYDPQTSGGLLVAIAADRADAALQALGAAGVAAHQVGRVVDPSSTSPKVAVALH